MDSPIIITHVLAPKFYLPDYQFTELNEYELRLLQYQVSKGYNPAGIRVQDVKGDIATINERGGLDEQLFGYNLSDELAIMLHEHRNNTPVRTVNMDDIINHFIVDLNEPDYDPDPLSYMYGE